MMSFPQVLHSVSEAFKEKRDQIHEGAQQMKDYLQQSGTLRPARAEAEAGILDEAARTLARQIDRVHGGTQGAPKFPQPMALEFMLRYYHRTGDRNILALAELSLEKMARGGIYDQLGGGFHRYSVDDRWLVPHFEKMLYDNALLARVYLAAFQLTGNPLYSRIVQETLDYVMREMVSPEGGFYSTQDADSEGEEGKFYVWSPAEIVAALGPEDGKLFNLLYDVSQRGNFEGRNILNLPRTPGTVAAVAGVPEERMDSIASEGRRKLYEARSKRVWPGRDEKILVGWNGLMLRAFAEAASVFGRDDYRSTAIRNAEFMLSALVPKEGVPEGEVRLFRTYKDGKAHINAFAEDYAFYAAGLLSLYEATFEPRWVETARAMLDTLVAHFSDPAGGFFTTADFHESLVARPKELYDNAIPSPNSVGAEALLRLYLLTAEQEYEQRALQTIQPLLDVLGQAPTAFGQMLCALDLYLGPSVEVALIGELRAGDMAQMLGAVWGRYAPNKVVALAEPEDKEATRIVPLLADRPQVDGKATAYVCRNYICEAPTTDPSHVARLISGRSKG